MFPCLPLVPLMITQVVYEGGRHRVHGRWGKKNGQKRENIWKNGRERQCESKRQWERGMDSEDLKEREKKVKNPLKYELIFL